MNKFDKYDKYDKYDKKKHYDNYQFRGSFLEKIFTFKIFFQISFFWFCFNSLMSTMEYLYFNTIKKGIIKRIHRQQKE